jgi:hypothetical protein
MVEPPLLLFKDSRCCPSDVIPEALVKGQELFLVRVKEEVGCGLFEAHHLFFMIFILIFQKKSVRFFADRLPS